jgi:RimJ/RimL family protein N-acetyltransferase
MIKSNVTNNPPLTLNYRGLELVAPARRHLKQLHQWETDIESQHLWSGRRAVLSDMDYEAGLRKWIDNYCLAYFVLESNGQPIGFVYASNANLTDGWAYITVFIASENRDSGWGAKSFVAFSHFLFASYPLRKIYCDVYGYNNASKSSLITGGFVEEGVMRCHKFFAGEYHDLHRFAMFRESFYGRFSRFLERMSRS